jgi:hypothetical protein
LREFNENIIENKKTEIPHSKDPLTFYISASKKHLKREGVIWEDTL